MNQNILNKKEEMLKQIKVVESAIDLNKIVNVIMTDFRIQTEGFTREFYKLSKKNIEEQRLFFIEKNIVPLWESVVCSKFEDIQSVNEILDKKMIEQYVFGLFVSIHSQNLSNNIHFLIKGILSEMILRTLSKIK